MEKIDRANSQRPATFSRLPLAVASVPAAAAAGVFIYIALMLCPVDIDETMRLVIVDLVLDGRIPLRDFVLTNFDPGFWIAGAPMVWAVPKVWLPLASRAWGICLLVLALSVVAWLHAKRDRKLWRLSSGFSLALLAASPHMLYKIAEYRPDALSAALLLAGTALYILPDAARRKSAGLLLLGAACAVRIDVLFCMIPVAAGAVVEWRAGRMRTSWLLSLALVPVVTALLSVPFLRGWGWQEIVDLQAWLRMTVLGAGITMAVPYYWHDIVGWALIGTLGTAQLLRDLFDPHGPKWRSLALAVLGSAALTLIVNIYLGALFIQNLWRVFYLLAPFAGILVCRNVAGFMSRRNMRTLAAWLPLLLALWCLVWVALPVRKFTFVTVNFPDPSTDLRCRRIPGETLVPFGHGEPNAEPTLRRPMDLVRFGRWLTDSFGNDFTLYSNDFLLTVGRRIPPETVTNMDMPLRAFILLQGDDLNEGDQSPPWMRCKLWLMLHEQGNIQPGSYLMDINPDVLVADHMLQQLLRREPELCRFVAENYLLTVAPGHVAAYIRR